MRSASAHTLWRDARHEPSPPPPQQMPLSSRSQIPLSSRSQMPSASRFSCAFTQRNCAHAPLFSDQYTR